MDFEHFEIVNVVEDKIIKVLENNFVKEENEDESYEIRTALYLLIVVRFLII